MTKLLRTFLLLLMAFVIFLNADQTSAYCIYNDMNEGADFYGEYCSRCFSGWIGALQNACCPGDSSGCRGDTWISMVISVGGATQFSLKATWEYTCAAQVDAHGWVRISKRNDKFWCVVYREGGSVKADAEMRGTRK